MKLHVEQTKMKYNFMINNNDIFKKIINKLYTQHKLQKSEFVLHVFLV